MGVVVAGSVPGTRSDVLVVYRAVCSRAHVGTSTAALCFPLMRCYVLYRQKIPRMAAPPPRLMWKYPEHYKVSQT